MSRRYTRLILRFSLLFRRILLGAAIRYITQSDLMQKVLPEFVKQRLLERIPVTIEP